MGGLRVLQIYAQVGGAGNTMNRGERDELLVKLTLVYLKHQGDGLHGVKCVTSVGDRSRVYRDWDPTFGNPRALTGLSDSQLVSLARALDIKKTGAMEKADVHINGAGFSLKSTRNSPPAIVNHTARPGWEFACGHARVSIAPLDSAIASYWALRSSGQIMEDIGNDDPISPFASLRSELAPVLTYFMFVGTGTKLSVAPASTVLEVGDATDPTTWRAIDPASVVGQVWGRLVFSLRSKKGMPLDYPRMKRLDAAAKLSVAKWTRFWKAQYRGALHVRVRPCKMGNTYVGARSADAAS